MRTVRRKLQCYVEMFLCSQNKNSITIIVFEVSPSHRLGDKVCNRRWASGSPRPPMVWRPPHTVRRLLGGICETCGGKAPKSLWPTGINCASAPKAKGQESTRPILLFAREISCSRLLPRVQERERKREGGGQGERKRKGWAGIELCLAAPLLESAGRSPLHLRSALCTFRGAAPASPLGRSSIDVRLLESLPLLAVRTFRTPPAIRNAASSSHRRPQVHPLRVTVAFAGPSAPHLSVRFESVRTSVFWLTKSAAFHICLLWLCSYW